MPGATTDPIDPTRDLVFERVVPLTRAQLWQAWTTPALLVQWFCPRPWSVAEAILDVRPGGRFFTVMQSPEGERFPGDGCFLEVVDGERLSWTNALGPGFRPVVAADPSSGIDFAFTGILTFTDAPGGAHYHAIARHGSAAHRDTHAGMGFAEGWGIALDQLVEVMTGR